MKPIFFIDYDNTIFSHRTWSVPKSALQALESLKEDGFRVVLASGRAFRSYDLPEEFGGRFIPDGLVSANGAILEAEGRLIRETYFEPGLQRRILDYVTEKGYCLISNYGGTWCTSSLERFKSLPVNSSRKILPQEGDAFLLIGDKVFDYEGHFTHTYDLADCWRELTGKPFVFAVWVARKGIAPEVIDHLEASLELGVERIWEAINESAHRSKEYAYTYLTENIDFLFDYQKRQALELYWDKGRKFVPRANPG